MDYKIVRSSRKSMGIYVLKDGSVEVRCPYRTPAADIERFVKDKQAWINETSLKMSDKLRQKMSFSLNIGDTLPVLGKEYPITAVNNRKYGFDWKSFYIPENISPDGIKFCIINTYKRLAKQIIVSKVNDIAPQMHVNPSAVKINSANTRWGSCSGKNSLNFSWKLIMADERAVDYVVVHELAHIIEHNHSKQFWNIVERFIPDYRMCMEILDTLAKKLSYELWD